jgi:hypothetical protein
MSRKLKSLSGALILAVASVAMASVKPAQAQTERFHPIADDFNRQFFEASGDFYHNVSLQGYLGDYLGIGSPSGVVAFPEKEMERDASRVNGLYRRIMQRQVSSDPILRVPDAVNPFFTENFGFKAPSFARRLFLLVYVNIKTVNIKNK